MLYVLFIILSMYYLVYVMTKTVRANSLTVCYPNYGFSHLKGHTTHLSGISMVIPLLAYHNVSSVHVLIINKSNTVSTRNGCDVCIEGLDCDKQQELSSSLAGSHAHNQRIDPQTR